MRKVGLGSSYAGVDPSTENTESARAKDLTVLTGPVPGAEAYFASTADLTLTANVISHVPEPIAFLESLAAMTVDTGRVMIYGHNGDEAGKSAFLRVDVTISRRGGNSLRV